MNRLLVSALGLAGTLALVAAPAAAQHRRGGEGHGGGNGSGDARQEQRQDRQESRRESRPESRQESRPAPQPQPQAQAPAATPAPQPRFEERAVPRSGFDRGVPRQGAERSVPQQGVERAVPRQDFRPPRTDDNRGARNDNNWRNDNRRSNDRGYYNGRYDNRRYGYAAPRYVGPRYYSGRYDGPRYVGPRFTIAPRRFYRPYYSFRPRISIGFGIWAGFPVSYYDPYYYPYDYYPYASTTPGYVAPSVSINQANMGGLSFSISPDTAEVWVDGEYFGAVGDYGPESQPLGLPAGRHHVELREPGYQVSAFEVDIIAGQVLPYQGQLQP
jgi:hypothetical protein